MTTHIDYHDHNLCLKMNREYWQNNAVNEVCPPEYYSNCSKIIDKISQNYIKSNMDVIDLGCSDGTFSVIMANYANQVYGFEYSEPMLERAKSIHNLQNVNYEYLDMETKGWSLPKSHVTFWMGLTMLIHDNNIFESILDKINYSLTGSDTAILVTRDSLSLKETFRWFNPGKHYGIYRNYKEHFDLFEKYNFHHLKEIENFTTTHTRNSFHIWKLK